MKAITIREYSWNEDKEKEIWGPLGTLVHETDESEDYEINACKLFNNEGSYTLISANGCSCWDGDWEGWTDLSLEELQKLGDSWAKDTRAEKAMGEYIQENF